MKKYRKSRRIIATFFLLIFFPTLVPSNLYASNNGPKSPEASSFEPVDATDMVNLVTGQYSYVLPLLDVPSPEGGYPLALSYHAGIALDQQASWTGLGWNLNPGAIDRGVNDYPDDYNASRLNEYFYDEGETVSTYSLSLGYTNGAVSVGLGFNWGSHQALGGSVSVGYGANIKGIGGVGGTVSVGSNGASIGLNANLKGGLTLGIDASTNGDVSGEVGFSSNGSGFSISTNGTITQSIGITPKQSISIFSSSSGMGVSLSSKIKGLGAKRAGVGFSTSFNNTISMGDYSTSSSSWMIPIAVPTPIGVFSLSFGKQEFKYWLGKNENNYVTGPFYYEKGVRNVTKQVFRPPHMEHGIMIPGNWYTVQLGTAFMDINEIPFNVSSLATTTNQENNNLTFPSYDSYNVQAQGLGGSMSSTLYENGGLFGLSDKENNNGYSLKYSINGTSLVPDHAKFDAKPFFYLDNEISTYVDVQPANFNSNLANTNILNHYLSGVELSPKARRQTSTYVEYYTNEQINSDYSNIKSNGFLQPSTSTGFDRSVFPKDGIGAFKITTVDGKTYHYSLPVYNHEVVTRTFGTIEDRPSEAQSYFEKRQLEPYATHWLLTAVTGPDYIDNGDGIAGVGDLGYWTSFEYGKWTDAYVWKAPYKKAYIIDEEKPNIKSTIIGRKQIYYLDKVKTRTHTALFIKAARSDGNSNGWNYKSVIHQDNLDQDSGSFVTRFNIPQQSQMRLNKIILIKNEDDVLNKSSSSQANMFTNVAFNNSDKEYQDAQYNCINNIIDTSDNWGDLVAKSIKVIDLNYDNSLVPGDNRLTLKSVDFKGKAGNSVLPPYKFEYDNESTAFNIDRSDDGWGYLVDKPHAYSLRKITTPQGSTISVQYESNVFKSLTPHKLRFSNMNPLRFKSTLPTYSSPSDVSNKSIVIDVGSGNDFSLPINKIVNINLSRDYVCFNDLFYYFVYNGTGHITHNLGGGKYRVAFDNNVQLGLKHNGSSSGTNGCDMNSVNFAISSHGNDYYYHRINVDIDLDQNHVYTSGGARVQKIIVSDGIENYVTDYKYGNNEDGIGYISYLPYSQNSTKEVPYSAELPSPRVMYEYVTMSSHGNGTIAEGKIRYKFNIMKQKNPSQIEYGDFYKIEKTQNTFNNSAGKKVDIGTFVVKDNLSAIGQLLEVASINSQGQILNKINNNYYPITSIPNNIGVTKESYQTYKTVDYAENTPTRLDRWIVNSTTRIKYPTIIMSSIEQKDGYSFLTEFKDYDLISGVSKEQWSISSNGESLKTKIVPAYTKYPTMGSKVSNINNVNMLSQIAAEYSYILDSGIWKETGVGITTWSNVWSYKDIGGNTTTPTLNKDKIWRKHKSYVWNGLVDSNGIFSGYVNTSGSDDGFDWTIGVGSQPSQWKQISEVTLYDNFSNVLEAKDINQNLVSTKMGDYDSKTIATGNAGYNEMFYSGAENIMHNYWLEPEVRLQNGTRNNSYSHTGLYSVETSSNSQFGVFMRSGQHKAGKYKLSVWIHKNNVANARLRVWDNTNLLPFSNESYTAGDWVLKTAYFDVTSGDFYPFLNSADGSKVYYDDLMIRPVVSKVTGYVYNQYDELTHIIGNNGLATRFEYDNSGALIKTYVEVIDDASNGIVGGFKLKTENKIKYKNL